MARVFHSIGRTVVETTAGSYHSLGGVTRESAMPEPDVVRQGLDEVFQYSDEGQLQALGELLSTLGPEFAALYSFQSLAGVVTIEAGTDWQYQTAGAGIDTALAARNIIASEVMSVTEAITAALTGGTPAMTISVRELQEAVTF